MKRTSRNRTASVRTVLLSCALVLLIIVAYLWRGAFSSVLWSVASPVLSHNPLQGLVGVLQSNASLRAQNEALTEALASTTAALADRTVLYQEDLALKARLGRDVGQHTLLAGVIMRPPQTPYDTLQIDAGSAQGVMQNALVSAGGTTVIGEVDEVEASSARVVLFSAPGESYQALLMETSAHPAVPLTVVGQGGDTLSAQVPADTGAVAGDSVVIPGIAGGYTAQVVAVGERQGESFETLYLRLPVNPQGLRFVEVLLP